MAENLSIEQYISSRRQAGASDNEIQSELQASGWDNTAISRGLNQQNPVSTNANKKILLPILTVAIILLIAAVLGWYFFQNGSNILTSENDQVVPAPSSTTNPTDLPERNENDDSYELNRVESTNRAPYVAAASDVEQIINAVHRYNAFQGTYPTSLQDMVDKEELTQSFVDRKQPAYTLTFSATNAEDCKVVATFSDGQVITSMCEDPNYSDQFTEYYDTEYQ